MFERCRGLLKAPAAGVVGVVGVPDANVTAARKKCEDGRDAELSHMLRSLHSTAVHELVEAR